MFHVTSPVPTIDLAAIFNGFNLATPTWDVFIVLLFLVGSLIYGFSLGRDRVVMLIVAIYMALAVVGNAPYLDRFRAIISLGNLFAFQITTFFGMFLVLFFFLSRSALASTFGRGETGRWWHVILFSFLHVGLLMSTTLSFLPDSTLGHLLPQTRMIFTGDMGRFLWIILPIAAMLLVRSDREDRR